MQKKPRYIFSLQVTDISNKYLQSPMQKSICKALTPNTSPMHSDVCQWISMSYKDVKSSIMATDHKPCLVFVNQRRMKAS